MPGTPMRSAVAELAQPAAPPAKSAWRSRLELLLVTGGAQAGIQLLGVVTGLVLVRLLPVREYAYYTMANAALGTMTVLTDSGISQSVMAQGGKVWQSPSMLGAVVACGMMLRRRFAVLAILVSMPILFLLLRQQGAAVLPALLVAASVLPQFLSMVTGQVLEVVPRLHQRLSLLQGIQLSGALLRFVTAVGLTLLSPLAWLATLGAGLGQIWTTRRVRSLARTLADLKAPPDSGARAEIVRQVGRSAPSAVYYAFAGQLTVWLIAVFGNANAVAQMGALTRLAMAYSVLTAVFTVVVVPRFARARFPRRGTELLHFWRIQLALLALLGIVVLSVAAFPEAALMVLGRHYLALTREVVLVAVGGALATLAGSAYTMAAARGVVTAPWVVVPLAVLIQIVLILTLPMGSVSGVLWLGVLSNLAFWLMHALNYTRFVMLAR
jgi:O-antigen/teichoic acid export membrane protein